MAATLIVRTTPKARIWTGETPAVDNFETLTPEQAKRLRQRITNLAKRDESFTVHASALRAGKTVKGEANGMIAQTIEQILAS